MNAEMFTFCIQTQLVPTLRAGDVVSPDNLQPQEPCRSDGTARSRRVVPVPVALQP